MENGHEPAIKADLKNLRDEVLEADKTLRDELREAIRESETSLREFIHDTATKHLRAFYDFAETNQKQVSGFRAGTDQHGRL